MATKKIMEQEVGDELLLYNNETNGCHALQAPAAQIYRGISEGSGYEELVERYSRTFGCDRAEAEVGVDRACVVLEDAELIDRPAEFKSISLDRRKLLKAAGAALLFSAVAKTPAAAASSSLQIIDARYGAFEVSDPNFSTTTNVFCGAPFTLNGSDDFYDVTTIVQSQVTGDTLSIGATNANFGDPINGTVKELRVTYRCLNATMDQYSRVCENAVLAIDCTP